MTSIRKVSTSLCSFLFVFAFSLPSAAAQETEVFYNLSDDPNSLQLLDLSNIGSENDRDYLNIVDLYRGELEQGLINTWEIDCAGERMGIVKAVQFDRASTSEPEAIDGEVISARSSDKSWTIFSLVCQGEGNLAKRRVYDGPLDQIVAHFWRL